MPFYLGIGNHEIIPPKTEDAFKRQFADWLDLPVLRAQREKDKELAQPETYYHWIQNGVDFIYLDNASNSFSPPQLAWFKHRLESARTDLAIMTVVVGMHEALPDSIAESHSMGDSAAGRTSGQQVYEELEEFRDQSSNADEKHKNVYVLASHSHFYMQNIFDSETLTDEKKKQPLLGWIIGTGGAERYALPLNSPNSAETDVYGYLLATVSAGGTIDFSFQKVNESDVPQWVRQRYPAELVPWCFAHNSKNRNPLAPELTPRCAVPEAATTPISPSSH